MCNLIKNRPLVIGTLFDTESFILCLFVGNSHPLLQSVHKLNSAEWIFTVWIKRIFSFYCFFILFSYVILHLVFSVLICTMCYFPLTMCYTVLYCTVCLLYFVVLFCVWLSGCFTVYCQTLKWLSTAGLKCFALQTDHHCI